MKIEAAEFDLRLALQSGCARMCFNGNQPNYILQLGGHSERRPSPRLTRPTVLFDMQIHKSTTIFLDIFTKLLDRYI